MSILPRTCNWFVLSVESSDQACNCFVQLCIWDLANSLWYGALSLFSGSKPACVRRRWNIIHLVRDIWQIFRNLHHHPLSSAWRSYRCNVWHLLWSRHIKPWGNLCIVNWHWSWGCYINIPRTDISRNEL